MLLTAANTLYIATRICKINKHYNTYILFKRHNYELHYAKQFWYSFDQYIIYKRKTLCIVSINALYLTNKYITYKVKSDKRVKSMYVIDVLLIAFTVHKKLLNKAIYTISAYCIPGIPHLLKITNLNIATSISYYAIELTYITRKS